jgi:cell division protease FtsH
VKSLEKNQDDKTGNPRPKI